MEQNSVINDFEDMVEEKPIVIVTDSLLSEHHAFISNIKADENVKSTIFHQDRNAHDAENSGAINTVDNVKRWIVSSLVVLPIEKTEDSFNIEGADISTSGMLLVDSVKKEDTDTCGAEHCEQNEQLEFIPNVIMEQSIKSDVLLSPSNSNEQLYKNSSAESEGNSHNVSISNTEVKERNQKLAHVLYRNVDDIDEIPKKIKRNSVCVQSLDYTVTPRSSSQRLSECSNVIQQSDTRSVDKPFKSHLCGNSFLTDTKFKVHNRTHTDRKPYKCDVCNKEFTCSSSLKRHLLTRTGEKPYKCEVCNKTFTQSGSLGAHRLIHKDKKPHTCEKKKGNLTRNKHVHARGKPYTCGLCNKSYVTLDHLSTHHRSHTRKTPYKCDVCYEEFSFPSSLRKHQRVHTGEKPYKCDVCNREYTSSSHFKRHLLTHPRQKSYKCSACDKAFSDLKKLGSHVNTCESLFKCDVCDKAFTGSTYFRLHQHIHTSEKPHKLTHIGKKPYKCDVCNREFTCSSYLNKRHMLKHTGEKPYKCEVCNKTFTQSGSLGAHQITHKDEKPHTCDICKKTFKCSSSLIRHQQTSTHKKPYKCEVCNEEFSWSYSLIEHQRTHYLATIHSPNRHS